MAGGAAGFTAGAGNVIAEAPGDGGKPEAESETGAERGEEFAPDSGAGCGNPPRMTSAGGAEEYMLASWRLG